MLPSQEDRAEKTPLHGASSQVYGASTTDVAHDPRSLRSVLLFDWFSPLVALANTRSLTTDDLLPVHDPHGFEQSSARVKTAWASERSHNSKEASLLVAFARAFGLRVASLALAIAISKTVATMLPPLIIEAVVAYAADPTASTVRGLVFALVVAVSGVLQSLARRQLDYLAVELAVAVKSSVSTVLFEHTLVVSPSTLQRTAPDRIISRVTTDPVRIYTGLLAFFNATGAAFQTVFGCILLHQYIGNAMWAGVIVAATSVVCQVSMDRVARRDELPLVEAQNERLQLTRESLAGIKTLKLLTWESIFADRILELKESELRIAKKYRLWLSSKSVLISTSPLLTGVASIVAYAFFVQGPMDSVTILPAMVLMSLLLCDSFTPLPTQLAELNDALKSLQKINVYLVEPERALVNVPHPASGIGVVVKNADFKWDRTNPKCELDLQLEAQGIFENTVTGPVLHHINFYAQPGEIHAVVGASESGKSSLLAGIVGLVRCTAGDVSVHGSVAYITREPFLLNASIRENICFGMPFDAERYLRVVQASCSECDWSAFPRSDQTQILSEKGPPLTSAQRIRIALARSLYQNADIYVLDDILASMDGMMAEKVFKTYVHSALKDKIVIIATQSLNIMKKCTKVAVLARGTIIEAGSFKTLAANKKSSILSDVFKDGSIILESNDVKLATHAGESSEEVRDGSENDDIPVHTNFFEFAPITKADPNGDSLIEIDPVDDNLHVAAALWLLQSLSDKGYSAAAILTTLYLATPVFGFYALTSIGGVSSAGYLHEGYIGYSILSALASAASSAAFHHCSVHASQITHHILLRRLCRAPMAFFDATPMNRVFGCVSNDLAAVENTIVSTLPRLFACSAQTIVTTIVLMALSPWLLLTLAPLSMGLYRLQECIGKPTRALDRIEAATSSRVQSTVAELLRRMAAIRYNRAEHLFVGMFHSQLALHNQALVFNTCASSWLGVRVDALHIALMT